MNYEIYKTTLGKFEKTLKDLRTQGIAIATGIIGETLTKDDLFFCASLDRCLRLIDGVIPMLEERNLTCAGALLRLQMDNCLRTYAAFIAADKEKVIDCIISGDPIKNEKDTTGQKMTDGHLKDEISKIDSQFAQVYDQASGFIHLSSKAFYQTVAEIGDDNKIAFQIGHPSVLNLPGGDAQSRTEYSISRLTLGHYITDGSVVVHCVYRVAEPSLCVVSRLMKVFVCFFEYMEFLRV